MSQSTTEQEDQDATRQNNSDNQAVTNIYLAHWQDESTSSTTSYQRAHRRPQLDIVGQSRKRVLGSSVTSVEALPQPIALTTNDTLTSRKRSRINSPNEQLGFIYGNYRHYYGYRHAAGEEDNDPRVQVMEESWFKDQQVLDIGCNAGYVTVEIAWRYRPQRILGVDIDEILIDQAWRHLRYRWSLRRPISNTNDSDNHREHSHFPISMPVLFGPLPWPKNDLITDAVSTPFPLNIDFSTGDWQCLPPEPNTYDTILALSITKWIHLHKGDDGIRSFFHRIYASLRSGGRFVLEPQPWRSYTRKSKLTPEMRRTYESIQFRPDEFETFLIDKVGFIRVEERAVPHLPGISKGTSYDT
ncbi:Bicoid-interacting protein 3-domain-containing protein [Syncephalis plumigaleata]|nr:Bicoid-interacting protein 3-domain-containing protein [Syncephalis plumigaleata]